MTWNKTGIFVAIVFFLMTIGGAIMVIHTGWTGGRLLGMMLAPLFGIAFLWMAKE